MESKEGKKDGRDPSKPQRRKYEKPSVRSARFAEQKALACLKTADTPEQEGCVEGFFS